MPITDYSSGIWIYLKSVEGEKIQNRVTIFYLGVPKKAPNLAIQGDMGWTRTKVRHKFSQIRKWNRLIQMPDERLTKRCLIGIMKLEATGHETLKIFYMKLYARSFYYEKSMLP